MRLIALLRALTGVGLAGWYHLALFGLLLPAAALRSRQRLHEGALPARVPFFRTLALQQVGFTVISLVVAHIEAIDLWPSRWPAAPAWGFGAALLVALVVAMQPIWWRAVADRDPRVHLTAPRTAAERRWWVVVATAAGIGEELTYRGVLFALVVRTGVGVPAAALLSAGAFGLAHAVQGRRGVLAVTAVALAFQGLVVVTGSLVVAMVVHAIYDVVAGFSYSRYAELLGYPADGPG